MTQDKVTFRDLLGRVGYSSTPGVINIFSSLEHVCVCVDCGGGVCVTYALIPSQEALTGARLLKRMTFAILSGERDQYVSYLPDVQGGLTSSISMLMLQVRVISG